MALPQLPNALGHTTPSLERGIQQRDHIPKLDLELACGPEVLHGGPEFGPESDNNTFFSSLFFKLNENWATRFTHHFEGRDGTMEEQYYTFTAISETGPVPSPSASGIIEHSALTTPPRSCSS